MNVWLAMNITLLLVGLCVRMLAPATANLPEWPRCREWGNIAIGAGMFGLIAQLVALVWLTLVFS